MRPINHVLRGLYLLFSLALCGWAHAASTKPLIVATGILPAGRANPHDSISMTRAWLYAALYDSLTFIDRDGKLLPWLAESWTQESPTAWRFNLRPGVVFSSGKPMTSADVIANIDYLRSPAGKPEPVSPFVAGISAMEAAGDGAIIIHTAQPDATLPQKLSLLRIATIADGQPITHERLINSAIGTGPYAIESWATNKATLTAVKTAWRKAPTEILQAVAVPDATQRRTAVSTGIVDVAFAAFNFVDLDDKPSPIFTIEEDQIPAVVGMAYNNVKDTPFRDERVRRAMTHAVNIKAIVAAMFGSHGIVAAQPVRKEALGFNPALKPLPYDVEKARALLKEAGYGGGFAFTMALTGGANVWDQVFQLVAADLNKVNVHLTIKTMPEATIAEMMYTKGFKEDAIGFAYFSPTFDGLEAMRQQTCSWPVAWYCDPEAEALRLKAATAGDVASREALTRQLMTRAYDTTQGMFLYESVGLVGHANRIKGFRSDFGFLRYELMTVDDK